MLTSRLKHRPAQPCGATVGHRDAQTDPRPHTRAHAPARPSSPFDEADLQRIRVAIGAAEHLASADAASVLVRGESVAAAAIRRSCTFAHSAILLFPDALDSAMRYFADQGLDPQPSVPSVLVRRRLCERYGLDHDACDVSVTRLRPSPAAPSHTLEVFLFPRTAEALRPAIIDNERAFQFENHLALDIAEPDERRLEALLVLLQSDVGLVWEGGGHNRFEGSRGSTVFYFVGERFERWELHCEGDFSLLIDRHQLDSVRVAAVYASWTASACAAGANRP